MADTPKLAGIEAARGLAALAVVVFHAETIVAAQGIIPQGMALFGWGERGVDFFFVLSGFIIGYVHRNDPSGWRPLVAYAAKRAIRILPLLWIVAGATFAANAVIDRQAPSSEQLLTSFLLTPSLAWPSPAAAWTLRHEVVFYVLFAATFLDRRLGAAVLALWFLACTLQALAILLGAPIGGASALIFSPLNIDFAFGLLAAAIHARISPPNWLTPVVGLVIVLATFVSTHLAQVPQRLVLNYLDPSQIGADLAFGVAFAILVFALAQTRWNAFVPRPMTYLGVLSYGLYLVHGSVMGLAGRYIPDADAGPLYPLAAFLFLIAASLGTAAVLHHAFDRPMTVFLRRRLIAPRVISVPRTAAVSDQAQ